MVKQCQKFTTHDWDWFYRSDKNADDWGMVCEIVSPKLTFWMGKSTVHENLL